MGLQHMCDFWCGTEKIKLERGESPFCGSVEVALEEAVELFSQLLQNILTFYSNYLN